MRDLIDRQAAIKDAESWVAIDEHEKQLQKNVIEWLKEFPPAELGTNLAEVGTDVHDINKFIDSLEEIFADIRERHVDDSVCGLCEYDGAYIGQSGDWCNECPGFDRDDCFKLSDKCRKRWIDIITKALPSEQPDIIRCRECKFASGDSRICMKFDHSPIGELDFCSFAERRDVNNESN